MVHDIDVTYYICEEKGCEYKAKVASSVKTHKAFVHNIDVLYYPCKEKGCNYEAKSSSHTKAHMRNVHGRL